MEDPPAGSGGASAEGPAAQVADMCWPTAALPLRLLEWKVKPGTLVNVDSVIALCAVVPLEEAAEGVRPSEKKVKSNRAGVVKELCCQTGHIIPPGGVIVRIEECSHPVVMKGLCAECGQDLTQLQGTNGNQHTPISTATVSMVHSVPELMVSSEQAEQLGREDQQRLHRNRKLVLMVDLDQTLIHTTEQHCQQMSNKGIFHFQLGRGEPMLHTRLRPHCKEFLEKTAKLYELHVFTFGSRLYAHTIAGFLDPEKKLFSHRILSRDECIDPFSKTGNLRYLFPCGDSMVCIIDDREDVWKFAPNLITVKKYVYFQGAGDINAPPGSREALAASKGEPFCRPGENAEQPGAEEQNNGLKKRVKEQRDDCTSSRGSQGDAVSERTALTRIEEEDKDGHKGSEPEAVSLVEEKEPQRADNADMEDGGRTAEPQDAPSCSNHLDFNLSSDSDSETDKPQSTDKDLEQKSCQTKASSQESEEQDPSDGNAPTSRDLEKSPEPSGVVLPEPELGNGCLDKREPETESQNSEQSGVTVGEELLDQSMEDEEEEADNDHDDHLIYLEEVLERIHAEYYARYEAYLRKETAQMPDIRKIVPELKSKTLEDATIVFSGLYPTNYPMDRTREYYHAKALGAKVSRNLILNPQDPGRTTHLIAARAGTEKVRQGQGYKHLHVVNPDWLWSCLERWERVDEQLYPLKDEYSKTPRSNSPAAFAESQGSTQKPAFQPIPIQPRPPPPAPESRTYDPVTGKLIRRGPNVQRPPSYLHPSSSEPRDQPSLRAAAPTQLKEAAGCVQDGEQAGPSRRRRQPSMSESMPLYMLCKEDLESMDREVDDILGEESDNESEGRGRERPRSEETKAEEERRPPPAGHRLGGGVSAEEKPLTASSSDGPSRNVSRGHKRKLEEEEAKTRQKDGSSSDESSKDSNEEEEGSSSEADEMAAALEAELHDFM
uniref:RNA polymerase II subunit A C-terminal domain phosphatase n=1 Tax=Oryzias latipes TaxID=8090 RepID=A0A3P9J5Z3_ORYLA